MDMRMFSINESQFENSMFMGEVAEERGRESLDQTATVEIEQIIHKVNNYRY
jgi:hypothetical protein